MTKTDATAPIVTVTVPREARGRGHGRKMCVVIQHICLTMRLRSFFLISSIDLIGSDNNLGLLRMLK